MAQLAMQRDRTQRTRIVIPEWSLYKDFAAVLHGKLPEDQADRRDVIESWAKACEVEPPVIDVILGGDVLMPRIELLRKLADHLGIPLSELVEPFEAWYTQVSTAESRKIIAWAEGNEHQAMIHTIILKLEDDAGKPVFTLQDKKQLDDAPATLIASIAQRISQRPTLKEQIKNS